MAKAVRKTASTKPTVKVKAAKVPVAVMKVGQVWQPTRVAPLEVGDLIRLGVPPKVYFVAMVNPSRARVIPITAADKTILVDDPATGEKTRIHISQTGDGVDISPNSIVERVAVDDLTEDEAIRAGRFAEMDMTRQMTDNEVRIARSESEQEKTMADVSAAPVADKKTNAVRDKMKKLVDKGAKARATKKAKGERVPGEKKEKKAKVMKPCTCGCGDQTPSYFVPGHDARFKGWLLQVERGKMKVEQLPKSVQKAYEWKKKGDGHIPTKNYKGEPHRGYDLD